MSKADKFIQDCTRNCSNEHVEVKCKSKEKVIFSYEPWLTPDQARNAVEIAREEMIEKACDAYCKICGHYPHTVPTFICRKNCDYFEDFKQAMNDE